MERKRIAVIMGGYSSEAGISLLSGQTVMNHLHDGPFEAVAVHILRDGWSAVINNQTFAIERGDFSYRNADGQKCVFEAVFNAIHGHPGEDGVLQAYFDILGLPYTSSGVFASALTFNKAHCSLYAGKLGLNVAKSIVHRRTDSLDFEFIKTHVGFPCFVKPNRSGSSFGVSRVSTADELPKALQLAYAEDDLVVIEKGIEGVEIACGLTTRFGKPEVIGITEIVSENAFFDYEAKYQGKAKEITPARISEAVASLVEEQSLLLYKHLELKGIARVDYIIENQSQKPYLIEVNSIPGLSAESIVPRQMAWRGWSPAEVFNQNLIECLKTV